MLLTVITIHIKYDTFLHSQAKCSWNEHKREANVCLRGYSLNPVNRFWLNLVKDECMAEIQNPCWNKEWKPKSVLYEHAPLSWEMNRVIEMCVICHSLSNILTEGNRNSGQWSRNGEFFITGTRARQEKLRGCVRETRKKENHALQGI